MHLRRLLRKAVLQAALGLLGALVLWPPAAPAQEEVTSSIRRYRERELSTGYYEEYEVKPRRVRPFVGAPEVVRRYPSVTPYRPRAAVEPNVRSRMEDSHAGIQFYELRRCEECHVEEAKHSHTTRGNLTCRQCHGGEPIAGINYYYSPLNPIRRHAYVCSKCHEGANISFATYLVHEPKAGAPATRKTFASLYYSNWFMYLLIVGTLAFFGLHTLIWMGKESYHAMREKMKPEPQAKSPPEKPEPEEPENE
ncbi:MAG: hypothetical protein HY743_03755 [Deltaproteobacteria bacterium]|nr:hypothetical protein [Deltaproteobacteria bacterium]